MAAPRRRSAASQSLVPVFPSPPGTARCVVSGQGPKRRGLTLDLISRLFKVPEAELQRAIDGGNLRASFRNDGQGTLVRERDLLPWLFARREAAQ
jgi:hypothetical protein